MVPDHQTRGMRAGLRTSDFDLLPDEGIGYTGDTADRRFLEHHRVFDFSVDDLAVEIDRGEGTDVTVHDTGALTDDCRTTHSRVDDHRTLLDHDATVYEGVIVDGAMYCRFDRFENESVTFEKRLEFAGVLPPSVENLVSHSMLMVDQPLDGIGDLEFPTGRGFDGRHGLMDEIPYLSCPTGKKSIAATATWLETQMDLISEMRYDACPKTETAIQNLIDEAVATYLSALYKLRNLE